MGFFDSTKKTENSYTDQVGQDLTNAEVDNIADVKDSSIVDTGGGGNISDIHTGKNSTSTIIIDDPGAVENAGELSMLSVSGASSNVDTALTTVGAVGAAVSESQTEFGIAALDNNAAIAGNALDTMAAFADSAVSTVGNAVTSVTDTANAAIGLAGTTSDNMAGVVGTSLEQYNSTADGAFSVSTNAADNIAGVAGAVIDGQNAGLETFSNFATTANNNLAAVSQSGFDALNETHAAGLTVIDSIAGSAIQAGTDANTNMTTFGIEALELFGVESSESKTLLTGLANNSLAVANDQFSTAITSMGAANSISQGNLVSMAETGANMMQMTLADVLTDGQATMQEKASKTMLWVSVVAVVGVIAVIVTTKKVRR